MESSHKQERIGYVQVFIAGALWGTIGMFVTSMNTCGSTSALTSFLRMFFAFIVLAVITLAKYGWHTFLVSKKTLLSCALLGLVCQGIYNVFYSLAIVNAGVAISAVLLNIAPVFTAITACILFSEKLTGKKTLALIINVCGCILAATGGSFSLEEISLAGILFGVGAGFCYSLTAIMGRIANNSANAFVVSTYSYLFAALFILLFMQPFQTGRTLSAPLLLWGFFYALIPTAAGYVIYYQGVQKIKESSKVPVIASVETVIAALIGVIVFQEKIQLRNLLGILLVMVSIFIMGNIRLNRKQASR